MPTVLGVDGCPHGWCAVQFDTDTRALTSSHHDTFREILDSHPRTVIAIDVPIGLMEGPGGRDCDREARKYLGRPRGSSVFPPPVRQILPLTGMQGKYEEACRKSREVTDGKAISQQSFWIGPKIREVDNRMTRALERRVYEAHPEVSFAAMNRDRPMLNRKGTREGRTERSNVLRRTFSGLGKTPVLPGDLRGLCDLEDYVDALACAWTAASIKAGDASPLPARPPRDPEGLRMAIWRPSVAG
jgi:predicted RNase H-like nuclease